MKWEPCFLKLFWPACLKMNEFQTKLLLKTKYEKLCYLQFLRSLTIYIFKKIQSKTRETSLQNPLFKKISGYSESRANAPPVRIFPSTFNSEACSSELVLLHAAFCSVCMQVLTLPLLPQLCSQLFAGEQGCSLIWITCIYLFKCPPQAVSGKGKAHASIASLMHIWLPYHEAGSKLQWALMFSRKWAETSLSQCVFFNGAAEFIALCPQSYGSC